MSEDEGMNELVGWDGVGKLADRPRDWMDEWRGGGDAGFTVWRKSHYHAIAATNLCC
mgnify:CR=1 FL=1